MATRSLCARVAVLTALAASSVPAAGSAADATAPAPGVLLQGAFSARYDCTLSGVVRIAARKGDARALERRVHVATKLIDDRLHTYAQFRAPEYIRGMAFLGIEPEVVGRNEQRFVYLPSMRRIRRVSGSHSSDSFLGTDLSYHDFERQHARNYEVAPPVAANADGSVVRLRAKPRFHTEYAAVEYDVDRRDHAILGTRYYKRDGDEAFKVMEMPRETIVERGHCRIPSVVRVSDRQRRTTTDLRIEPLSIDAEFDDSLFSMVSLEKSKDVPLPSTR